MKCHTLTNPSTTILHGDSLQVLKSVPDNYFDSVVTDPPYGLSFMGKKWDYSVPSTELWREVLRVLKPGGHLLSFGGTRTYHRMVVAIEDAGFEVRDQIMWIYGSGFPKSHDVSKGIDKAAGLVRERIPGGQGGVNTILGSRKPGEAISGEAISGEAISWQGWGTALKPANEPIVLARKPLSESTVAKNVVKHGTGGLNIDGTRIVYASESDKLKNTDALASFNSTSGNSGAFMASKSIAPNLAGTSLGRWPANVIFDESAAEILDAQSGVLKSGALNVGHKQSQNNDKFKKAKTERFILKDYGNDSGGASRFFYCAKASKSERNKGLEGEVKQKQGARPNSADSSGKFPDHDHRASGGNNHPTVKPTKLMEYLIKLVTPQGGTVLDPFMGSGSTGVAAIQLGLNFYGCEISKEYIEIAEKRIQIAGRHHR